MAERSLIKKDRKNERSVMKKDKSKSRSLSSSSADQGKMPAKEVAKPKTGGMKMFFLKIKQKCNIAKKTELPRELIDAVNEARQYRNALNEVAQAARAVTQQNPHFRNKEDLEANANSDEYEVIYGTLEPNRVPKKAFELYEAIEVYSPATYYLGKLNREYHQAATAALRPLMQFFDVEFVELEGKFEAIGHLRDESDIRQQEFEKSGVGAAEAQAAAREYEKSWNELVAKARQMVDQGTVDGHMEAIAGWSKLLKEYHQKMNAQLEKAMLKAEEATKAK